MFRVRCSLVWFVFLLGVPWVASAQRQMERLGRGVVAIRTSSTQVYVGWRLLGNDPEEVAFNLYRSANGAAAVKVNGSPITTTTNYVDAPGNLSTTAYTYSVRPVLNGVELADVWANLASGPCTLPLNASARQYLSVPMQPTPDDAAAGVSYDVKFCWVGDLDGDGEYDFVIDRSNPNVEARQWLQAYKRDGTLLWQMNMGPNSVDHYNITPGSSSIGIGHGDNVTVYDLDGDGKAEVIVRTANGVIFPNGTTLTAPDDEVQYISILEGTTGVEKARATIPVPAAWVTRTHMNAHMGIVYADGMKPSIFYQASNRNPDESFNDVATTWDYRGGVLSQRWTWPFSGHTATAHQIRLADVDNDGKDEYCDIGHVLKSDGSGQINGGVLNEVVHGDRFHITDIDPDRPGLETFLIQQNNGTGLATVLHAADKSAVIRKWYAGDVVDVGRGVVGDFDPSTKGIEMFSTQPNVYDSKGNALFSQQPFPPETIWWGVDAGTVSSAIPGLTKPYLGRQFIATVGSSAEAPAIAWFNPQYPGSQSRTYTIYNETSPGVYQAYGGRPAFWGDILGDWREELVVVANDNSELRIYTTKIPDVVKTSNGQPFRIYTLMHNPQYRIQATTKGYVQSSYTDYYLGTDMTPPPPPPMVDAKLVWRGGSGATTWDAGITPSWLNNGTNSTFANGDTVRFDIGGDATTAVALMGTLQPGAVTVYSPKDYAFTGSGSLGGAMTLMKAGKGTLTLGGTHAFTGKTTVWDGALVVNGSLQGSPVTVWGGTWGGAAAGGNTGGRIAGTGQFSQPVTIKYRGAITPGLGMGSAGALAFGNGLAAEDGAAFAMDLSDDSSGTTKANDRLAITGNLSLSGKVSIVVNPLNGALAPGTYTLATYTGTLTGSVSNLAVVVPAGTPYTLAADSGSIRLTVPVTRAAATVTWRGTGANWDLASSQNWLRAGSPDVFVSGDTVTFDNTGAASPTVSLATTLPVSGVTVNASNDYTFNGAGGLSGSGGLTKSGSGTLTLVSSNHSYTGPTVVNGGVLAVSALGDAGTPSSIGASSAAASNFVLNGGTLSLTASQTNTNRNLTLGSSGGTIDIALANSSIQSSGTISGSGALIKTGPGTLLIASANTYTGGTILNGGRIYLAGSTPNTSGLGSGLITINNGTLSMADVQASETAAWNVAVPAGGVARIDADGRCGLTGSLTGAGDLTFYSPYVRTDLKGNWSAFSGRLTVLGDFRIANSSGYAAAAVTLGDNAYAYYNLTMSGNVTLAMGELSGVSTAALRGGPTSGRTLTWQVGNKNTDSLYAGSIGNSTGITALTKVGTGTLMLSGACTHTGATTVQAGALVVTGSLTGSAVTVQNGATLGGSGSITGDVAIQSGGKLAFTAVNGVVSGLTINGNLTTNGTIVITPVPGTGAFPQGTYTIATYSGTLTGAPVLVWNPPVGSNQTATFDTTTAGVIKIVVKRGAGTLTWTGTAGTTWDTVAANWLLNGGSEVFLSPDSAVFDDTSSVNAITIAGPVTPGAVSVANTTKNYTLTAANGGIDGAGLLTKTGTGTLSLGAANLFSGGSVIQAGTIALLDAAANGGALGTGPVTLDGGTLRLYSLGSSSTSAGTFPNAIQVAAGDSGSLVAFGRGTLSGTVSGAGTLNFQTDYVRCDITGNWSAFTGLINVTKGPNGGDFRINNTNGFGTARINLATGVGMYMQVNFGPSGLTNTIGELTGTGELRGGPTAGRTMTWNVGGANTDALFSGAIKNGTGFTAITKSGSGAWTLAGASTYTGATTVSTGSLWITGSLGATAVSASSGATVGGTGTVGGNLTLGSGARLALGVDSTVTRGLTVSGTAVLNGAITVVPALLGGTLSPGTYTLLSTPAAITGSPVFTWNDTTGAGYTATFDTSTVGQVRITLTATVAAATFAQWSAASFSGQTDPLITGPNADPDKDGCQNLLEYFFGRSPLVAEPGSPLVCSQDGQGNIVLTFSMSKTLVNTSYKVRRSSDMVTWVDVEVIPVVVSENDTTRQMKAVIPRGTAPAGFLRLVVTGN
ncbi:autotransporter-associated beta strand repeat-containing protein [Luteolibacter ambystomatis]|uniref:Autotransporter-associated beta strand repeat-containing protein n=1 Tax=Luteolibacter ambystomatis TaxID=2824561 RepID=A0A975G5Q7_9BACT|nr:autotransporter-associated beta strand repeat-containing protein [Luteolibacter ambystomatis]QUE49325.1 autotransporter-associated beta strand repeat-containing protein [Luteolibacter ambystomatis]